jgi:hypothetical protein
VAVGGNTGGGVLATPGGLDYPPFARQAGLTGLAERLRAQNWPIQNSLQERSEADPNNVSVLDMVPAARSVSEEADADH